MKRRLLLLTGLLLLAVGVVSGFVPGGAVAQDQAAPEETVSPVRSVRVSEPRDFGYFPGDLIRREIYIAIDSAYKLQPASQPAAGPLDYWLDLNSVELKEAESGGVRRYRLTLDYQSFYVPLEVKRRRLPGFTLDFVAEGGEKAAAAANIPPWSFLMSPLREIEASERPDEPAGFLKPDRAPRLNDTRPWQIGLGASLTVVLLGLLLLAYHYARWPFHKRAARPFTEGARAIRIYLRKPDRPESYRGGLLALHRAFDNAAGRRLFAEDMPGFLRSHAAYAPYDAEIDRFFESSRQVFFNDDLPGAKQHMPLKAIAALGDKLGAAERRQ
ncbi:nonribosomal peptide synthetase MxaA [Methyloligella sp. 2.7D]|uniref:hypothetical protein n=1 Tax=unclassified Methyloligella TaxID=2625955 RepID=UPI00157C7228|nr:hypothetical protein [Methyloligella sp. GL2]QKP78068.1 hypothetical protein HT051_11830 [Methyloligella sp. GL2]